MEENLQDQEVLIARNDETGQIGAVTGLNEDGTPKMTDVKSAKLSDLVKFSKGQNPLEAFMSNFMRQCKNPSLFGFFKVAADKFDTEGQVMGDLLKDPEANKDLLKGSKVEPPEAPAQTVSKSGIDESKINWDDLKAKWGIDREQLAKSYDLDNMLHNRKSQLVTLTPTFAGEKFEIQARLSFAQDANGNVKVVPHFIRQEPNLSQEFQGVKFTKEDRDMLKATGNLGRVVDLTDANGNKIPSFVSIDRYTNELHAVPVEKVYIQNKIAQTELSPKEIGILKSGQQLPKDFTDKNGKTYPVVLQYSAAEQKVEFVPRSCRLEEIEKQKQGQAEANGQQQKNSWTLPDGSIKPLGKWKDHIFTDQEKADYASGKTVKIDNYVDKQGQTGTVYLRFDPEKGRPVTSRNDPSKAQQVTPASESATQLAVNNDGKTNEATKGIKDPLEKSQTQPKDTEQVKQQRKAKGPKM